MESAKALREIAFLLERAQAPTYRVRAFRRAAEVAGSRDDLAERAASDRLTELAGIGPRTAGVIEQAEAGRTPDYLASLRSEAVPVDSPLRAALRGDCHTHSDWSDGGSPVEEMARTARELGHEWMVLTDHSPRLTVAHGLSTERLHRQLELVAEINARMAPFRILTGIEVDILEDGSLDQDPGVLGELDFVVASVHSKLRMEEAAMTRRMCAAVANEHVDVLGHCTGRLRSSRPPSRFDPDEVFAACRDNGVAVEINSRPERLDPPRELLRRAFELGCEFAVDSDAHAPGQLDWQFHGCTRAEECGIPAQRVINTRRREDL